MSIYRGHKILKSDVKQGGHKGHLLPKYITFYIVYYKFDWHEEVPHRLSIQCLLLLFFDVE